MSEQNPVQQELLARLERLERRDRRYKRGGIAALLFFTCVGLMAQTKTTTKKKSTTTTPPATQPAAAPAGPTVVEAAGFILKDDNGRVRAELSMTGTGPSLKMRDQSGAALLTISLNEGQSGGPFVLLTDPQHKASVNMSALEGGGSQLALVGERPDIQMHFGVTPAGTTFEVSDKEGFGTTIGNTIQTAKNGKVKNTSGASVVLFDKERKTLWATP